MKDKGLQHFAALGTQLAQLVLGVWALSAVGCLVTDKIEYSRENTPPILTRRSPEAIAVVPPTPDSGGKCQAGTQEPSKNWMRFVADVTDPDVQDDLQLRVLVNGDLVYTEPLIPATGTVQREPADVCISKDDLSVEGCNHVEVLMSADFSNSLDFYETSQPGDLGIIEWWVLGPSDEFPTVDLNTCIQRSGDGGVP